MTNPVSAIQGDITRQRTDAIVNAANNSLLGGGGVDGAIHRAAGPDLLSACRELGGCVTGEAKITRGYKLPARWIIHTAGPIWRGGTRNEGKLLADCYRNCFAYSADYAINTIAFPSISTGAYRFPKENAARIALTETRSFLSANSSLEKVLFICFSAEDFDLYRSLIRELFSSG